MPSVSVIIPTHSRPHLLPRAVESALAAGTDVEVVVVDDASTDETAEICRALKHINYVRLAHNQGVAGARNVGMLSSSAEYIAFLDDDDLRLPGSLELQLAVLRNTPSAALVYGQALIGGATDRFAHDRYPQPCLEGDVFWQLVTQNFIPSGSALFRRSSLLSTGLLDRSIAGIDDWDLWVRVAALYPVAAVEQPVVIWRRPSPESDQSSTRAVEMVAMSTRQFRRQWLRIPRAAQASPAVRRKAARRFSQNMASHLASEALRSLSRGQVMRANRCVVAALRHHSPGLAGRLLRKLSDRHQEV
jgi:cellulose synthase/poly-beta-1,6-N-acetylglucosamine synthase-like glycosyltransferase